MWLQVSQTKHKNISCRILRKIRFLLSCILCKHRFLHLYGNKFKRCIFHMYFTIVVPIKFLLKNIIYVLYIKTFLPLGSESSYRHQLRGYLAGLAYLPGSNENEDVLKCLHQCAESLQIPAVTNVMSSGMEMVIDSKGSVVKVDGKTANDVASMVGNYPNQYFSNKIF